HNRLAINIANVTKNSLREFDLNWDLQRHSVWSQINTSRTDLIRLRAGQVYGQMWYVGLNCTEDPLEDMQSVIEQIDTLKRLIERHQLDLSLATSVEELETAIMQGKISSLIAVKGGHTINSKLGLLRTLYALGVRCMSLASEQNCCSWVDSSLVDMMDIGTVELRHDLSLWGRLVVWEMNRLGMIVDLSYASYGATLDVLRYSRAPVIFSNAGAYAINRHHLNVREDVLIPLATQGGLIMISFDPKILGGYTIDNVLEHLNYLREVIGPDHIGIGSGFEAFDSAIDGLEDVSKFANLFNALQAGRYSDGETFSPWSSEELRKLAGLNFLRVFHEVEQVKRQLSQDPPFEDEDSEDLNKKLLTACVVAVVITICAIVVPIAVVNSYDEAPTGRKFAGREVLDEVPLIDGHNDLPFSIYLVERNLINHFNLDSNLKEHPVWATVNTSHTDLPRLRQGKLGAQFWVAYIRCADTQYKDAVARTLEQIDVTKRIIRKYPNDLRYADSADGIMAAFRDRKLASLIAVEGGHSIDSRLAVLRLFYELGVRYLTLTHSCNTPWADASPIDDVKPAPAQLNNLSAWGRHVIWEMNRLGMMIDISHVSYGVMRDVLEHSRAPVIFSHSSAHAVHEHHRNVQDDILRELGSKRGIVMVNFYPLFVGGNTIDDVIKHLNHIRSITGVDHIGLGGDYNGVAVTPEGLEDVSKYPDLFDMLANGELRTGERFEPWTRDDLQKLAGLNLIRVFREVERIRDTLSGEDPYEDLIPYEEFVLMAHKKTLTMGVLILSAVVAVAIAVPIASNSDTDNKVLPEANQFFGRTVLDEVPLIDGHNDLPWNLYNYERNQINKFELNADLKAHPVWGPATNSHTDIPRLREGKVGAQFWVAYVACDNQYKDAVERTMEQIDVIKRMVRKYPEHMKYVTSTEGIMEAFRERKIGSLIAVEGGHSMDSRLAVLRMFYELGVRYMTLTHSCNTPWADASPIDNQSEATLRNVTDWGRNVLWEMNRLGMLIDVSHVSHGVMVEVLEHTKAPVIFSHSSSYAVFQHHRNVRDDVLKKLVDNNGIIMVNFYTGFIGGRSIDNVIEHLNYIKSITGPDHIGLGGDFDGVTDVPVFLDDVSKYPDLFDLLAEGVFKNGTTFEPWTREDLRKLAGENLLRVFREVERVRDGMVDVEPYEDLIPFQDFVDAGVAEQPCMSDIEIHK
uniref:Dipeptidase n=1 Tax=Anopheles epiroticus TaxID=199890 RepID=A0A182PEP3_9DIPT